MTFLNGANYNIKGVQSMLKRLLHGMSVLWGALTLVFILFAFVPDPARQLAGQNEREEVVEAIRAKHGLDRPVLERYVDFFEGLNPLGWNEGGLHWVGVDLGRSFISDRPVTEAIIQSLPATFFLATLAMTLALILGLVGGMVMAHFQDSWADRLLLGIASLGMSAPSFVMAIIVAWLFGSVWHHWTGLPMNGGLWEVDPFQGPQLAWRHAILPAITLGIRPLSVMLQLTRNSAHEVLKSSYVRTARSKGLSHWRIMTHHVLRNSLNPVVTAASGWFASMLAGAVFVEYVFGWQGMGLLMFRALEQTDLPMVMGCVATIAATFVLVNMLVDQIYRWLDPRVQLNGSSSN